MKRWLAAVVGVLVLGLAGATWIVWGLYQDAVARADLAEAATADASGTAEEERQKLVELRGRAAEAEGRLERLERENQELLAIKTQLARDVGRKDESQEQLKQDFAQLEKAMAPEIKSGEIRLRWIAGRVQVDFTDRVLFNAGEAKVNERGEDILARVGTLLSTMENEVQVSGHTDDSPPGRKLARMFPTNWELSALRATNVVRFLEEKAGVPGERLVASGYGPHRPVASNRRNRGRAKNRRIEILLTPVPQAGSKR